MRHVTIDQFLNQEQINKAIELKKAKEICKVIIEPNIEAINASLQQENDPMYLAYAVEYVVSQLEK